MDTTKLADWGTFLAGGITAVSVVTAAVTYVRAEGRKRKEFMATEYRRFRDTPAVQKIMLLLDGEWGGTKLVVEGKDVAAMDYAELTSAMRIHEPTMQFQPWEWEVRALFDEFLDGLVTFAQFLRCGLVKVRDLRPYLRYWLEIICGKSWMDQTSAERLWAYVDFYGFADLRWLAQKMGYSLPPQCRQRTPVKGESGESADLATRASATPAAGSKEKA